jgi:hypothetical protein
MIECKVVAIIVAKLMPSSFTKAITRCNKPNFSNKDQSFVAMDYSIVSFTSNTTTCMGAQVLFKKLITKAKVSTLLQDIHRSKLVDITIIDARFGKTCWSMGFLTMANNIFPTKED